jgi:hypothetical protein
MEGHLGADLLLTSVTETVNPNGEALRPVFDAEDEVLAVLHQLDVRAGGDPKLGKGLPHESTGVIKGERFGHRLLPLRVGQATSKSYG